MRLFSALLARFNNYKAKHYNCFEGRKLRQYEKCYSGGRCFIIGNGPSLSADDLTILHESKEITFAFNRIFQIFPQTPWRPTYFISQDNLSLSTSGKEMGLIPAKAKFIPIESHWYDGVNIDGATYFHLLPNREDDYGLFSDDISTCVYNSTTVAFTAIQFAVYMGFKEIYLLGVDHHFHTTRDRTGKIYVDETAKDYFADDYNKLRQGEWLPNVDASTMAFETARKYADEHGIKIYNATRGGKLEVFERVDFDLLF